MKKIILLLFGLLFVTQFYAKTVTTFTTTEGSKYVKCNVHKLVAMFKLTTSEWETKMVELGGINRELNSNGVEYTFWKKTISGDGIQSIMKSPGQIILTFYSGSNGITMFDELVSDLEKHFLGGQGDRLKYGFKYDDGNEYTVLMKRDGKFEALTFLRK